MSAITNVKEYFDTLDQRFDSEAAKGLTASFQFELGGDNGGTYCVKVNDGAMEIQRGW